MNRFNVLIICVTIILVMIMVTHCARHTSDNRVTTSVEGQ